MQRGVARTALAHGPAYSRLLPDYPRRKPRGPRLCLVERKRRSRAAYALPSRLRNRGFRRRNRNEESKQDTPPPNCRNLRRTFQIPTAHDAPIHRRVRRHADRTIETRTLVLQRPRPQRHPAVRQWRARSVRLRAARSAPSAGGSRRRIREIFSRCGQSAVQRHDPAVTRRKLPAKRPAASRGLRQVLPHRMDGTYESFSRNAAARRTGRTGQALLPRVRRNFPLP